MDICKHTDRYTDHFLLTRTRAGPRGGDAAAKSADKPALEHQGKRVLLIDHQVGVCLSVCLSVYVCLSFSVCLAFVLWLSKRVDIHPRCM